MKINTRIFHVDSVNCNKTVEIYLFFLHKKWNLFSWNSHFIYFLWKKNMELKITFELCDSPVLWLKWKILWMSQLNPFSESFKQLPGQKFKNFLLKIWSWELSLRAKIQQRQQHISANWGDFLYKQKTDTVLYST